jgi:hypothetical protein
MNRSGLLDESIGLRAASLRSAIRVLPPTVYNRTRAVKSRARMSFPARVPQARWASHYDRNSGG